MKKLTNLLLTLLLISLFSCQNKKATTPIPENNEQPQEQLQGQVEHKYKYVCSLSEIIVRSQPEYTNNAYVKGRIKLYEKVEVLEVTSELEEINNVKAYWFKIKHDKIEGWIFGGYLVDTLEEAKQAEYFDGLWIADKSEQIKQDTANYQVESETERFNVNFCGYDYEKNKLIFQVSFDDYKTIKTIDDLKMIKTDEMKKSVRKYVCFSNEICVRKSPDETAEIIGCLKNYDVVSVLEKTADLIEINKVKAYWFNVKAENVTGWIFGGYLVDTLEQVKKAEYVNGTWVGEKLEYVGKDIYNYKININNDRVDITYYGYDYEKNDQMFKVKYDEYELYQPIGYDIQIYYYENFCKVFDYRLIIEPGVEMYFEKTGIDVIVDPETKELTDGYSYRYSCTLKKIKD